MKIVTINDVEKIQRARQNDPFCPTTHFALRDLMRHDTMRYRVKLWNKPDWMHVCNDVFVSPFNRTIAIEVDNIDIHLKRIRRAIDCDHYITIFTGDDDGNVMIEIINHTPKTQSFEYRSDRYKTHYKTGLLQYIRNDCNAVSFGEVYVLLEQIEQSASIGDVAYTITPFHPDTFIKILLTDGIDNRDAIIHALRFECEPTNDGGVEVPTMLSRHYRLYDQHGRFGDIIWITDTGVGVSYSKKEILHINYDEVPRMVLNCILRNFINQY